MSINMSPTGCSTTNQAFTDGEAILCVIPSLSMRKRMRTESEQVGDHPLRRKYNNACPTGKLVTEVKRMSRAELEDLVMTKIVQILLYETEEGKFRGKIMELENHKEMLKNRVDMLNKQVVEMGQAVSLLLQKSEAVQSMQNLARPIKPCRNVGLQVDTPNIWNNLNPSPPAEHNPTLRTTQSTQTNNLSLSNVHTQTGVMNPNRSEINDSLRICQMVPADNSGSHDLIHNSTHNATTATRFYSQKGTVQRSLKPRSVPELRNIITNFSTEPSHKNLPSCQPKSGNLEAGRQSKSESKIVVTEKIVKKLKKPPLQPNLSLRSNVSGEIILSWQTAQSRAQAKTAFCEIYFLAMSPTGKAEWRIVSKIKSDTNFGPTTCTLTTFERGKRYVFAVRQIDVHGRAGPCSEPQSIMISKS